MGGEQVRQTRSKVMMGALAAMVVVCLIGLAASVVARPMAQTENPYPALPTPTLAVPVPETSSEAYPFAPVGGSIDVSGNPDWQGDQSAPAYQPMPVIPPVTPSPNGLLFLWLGFLVALLVFGTAVVGSILLFARRNEL